MFRETEQLKRKLDEMLASNDPEWINAVRLTLNALYTQFHLEQGSEQTIPYGASETPQSPVGLICNRRSQNRTQLRLVRGQTTELLNG